MTNTPLTRAIDRTTRAYAANALLAYSGYKPPTTVDPIAAILAAQREVSNAILNNFSACPHYTKVIDAQHSDQFWDVLHNYQELHHFDFCRTC